MAGARARVDLLVANGLVLTMDAIGSTIHEGAVAVRDGEIVAISKSDEIFARYDAALVIDAAGCIILPGLVDAYGHAGHSLIRGIFDPELGWPSQQLYWHGTTPEWWYAEARLAATERLQAGVTTGLSVIGASPARLDSPVFAMRNAQAYSEVGVRAVLGVGPPDPICSHLVEPWTGSFFEAGKWVERPFSYDEAVENSIEFVRAWHGGAEGRIRAALAVPYLFGRCVPHRRMAHRLPGEADVPAMLDHAEQMRELADTHGLLIQTHMFQGSVEFALRHFGAATVERLLGRDVVVAHANSMGPHEVEVLGSAACGIATVAMTHENLWYGVAPIDALVKAGARVAITTDGAAPYSGFDLWRELSRATWNQWMLHRDQHVLPPEQALRMVTCEAAAALGMSDVVGSLEVGKRGDLITVDLSAPHLTPVTSIERLLAFHATGHDVRDVVVDGRILMRDRNVISVDVADVMAAAREQAVYAFERTNLSPYVNSGGVWGPGLQLR